MLQLAERGFGPGYRIGERPPDARVQAAVWRRTRSRIEAGARSAGVDRITDSAGPAGWAVSQFSGPERMRPSTTGDIQTRRPGEASQQSRAETAPASMWRQWKRSSVQ